MSTSDQAARRRLAIGLLLLTLLLCATGLAIGGDGWSLGALAELWAGPDGRLMCRRCSPSSILRTGQILALSIIYYDGLPCSTA